MIFHFNDKFLEDGDVLLVSSIGILSKAINFFQKIKNGYKVTYSHACIFCDGAIFEARRKINIFSIDNFMNTYRGKYICIIRNIYTTKEKFSLGKIELYNNVGQKYPYWRLPLHAIDASISFFSRMLGIKKISVNRLFTADRPVCSEFVAQAFVASKIPINYKNSNNWIGVTPDDFDNWRKSGLWETIYEGKI